MLSVLPSLVVTLLVFLLIVPVFAQEPEDFSHAVTFEGETVQVHFTKFSSRGPLFEVYRQLEDGTLQPHTPGEVRTYVGSVDGRPGAVAAGLRRADGEIFVRVTFEDGSEWTDYQGTVSLRTDRALRPAASTFTVQAGETAGSALWAADVAIDLPYPQILASGGTADAALEIAEFSFTCMNLIYMRDTATLNRMGRTILRMDSAQDPYRGISATGPAFTEVKAQFAAYLNEGTDPAFPDHDLCLMASPQFGGGLASVAALGSGASANGSGSHGDFTVVGRHELGHNWGLGHFDGGGTPEGRTINSGNSLGKMSSAEIAKVLRHRTARQAHLEDLGSVAPSLPPRAADDLVQIEIGSGRVQVDVLANDNDVNGGALSITTFDSRTSQGSAVTRVSGSELEVEAPLSPHGSSDYTSYSITDSEGKSSSARLHLRPFLAGDYLGHFSFDDDLAQAVDSSSDGNHAVLKGAAALIDGVLDLSLLNDGEVSNQASADFLPRPYSGNAVTYAAHIYRIGDQPNYAGILFQNSSENRGLNFGTDNELRYHWDRGDWQFKSGLIVPERTWTFIALVVEPDKATFYMDDGTGMQSVVRSDTHLVKDLSGTLSIGRAPGWSRRFMHGKVDRVSLFRRALTASEILRLREGGLAPCDPSPALREEITEESIRLSWTPSNLASTQRLYLSRDYQELRDSVPGGPADYGIVTGQAVDLTGILPGYYYWRIETVESGGELDRGHIWYFQNLPEGLIAHWPLDGDLSTVGQEVITGLDATVSGNPTVKESGASLGTGSCLCCDGDDHLEVSHTPVLNPEVFTVSFWALVTGGSGSYRSPLTSRTPGTAKGYMFYANPADRWTFWLRRTDGGWVQINAGDTVMEQRWYQLTGTYDGTTARFYIDGELIGAKALTLDRNTSGPFRIGAGGGEVSPSYFFQGCVDEVRFWNRPLADREIASLSAYHRWAMANSVVDSAPATVGGNGLSHLINYALFQSPHQAAGMSLRKQLSLDQSILLDLPYPLRSDVRYTLQRSGTLESSHWLDVAHVSGTEPWTVLEPTSFSVSGPADRQQLRDEQPETMRTFWRLKVEEKSSLDAQ